MTLVAVEAETGRSDRVSRRRARARAQVLDVAEVAFARSAYRDVRMEDLAEAADVAVGSIYGYFGSKDGLYLALAERALEQFAEYLERAFQPHHSPLEQVLAAGDAYLRFHLEHPGSFRFLAFDSVQNQLAQVEDGLRSRVGERTATIIGGFQTRIEAAIAAGEADSGYDPRMAARFLWGAWNGVVSFSLRNDEMALTDADIATCLQLGRRLVSEGLTAPAFRDEQGRSRARLLDAAPETGH